MSYEEEEKRLKGQILVYVVKKKIIIIKNFKGIHDLLFYRDRNV